MIHEFASRAQAAQAAAGRIRVALLRKLETDQEASLIVTGGSSPHACYDQLADEDMPWDRVHVLLSDERWVASDDAQSNEKMVRERLLTGRAKNANLYSYFEAGTDIGDRCASLSAEIAGAPQPFAACLLGMGSDGHIASLFADAQSFDKAVHPDTEELCLPVSTQASPVPRVTLTLNALLRSEEILLLFFGEEKRAVYEQAVSSERNFPVSRLLSQSRVPVSALWAP